MKGINEVIFQNAKKYRLIDDTWKIGYFDIKKIEKFLSATKIEERVGLAKEITFRILKRHRKDELWKYLGKLNKIEVAAQILQPWLRDHVAHSLNTFLLGLYFLKKLNLNNYHTTFQWKIAGPLHDIGYPLEIFIEEGNEFFREVNELQRDISLNFEPILVVPEVRNIEKLMRGKNSFSLITEQFGKWGIDFDSEAYFNSLREQGRIEHGTIGSLLVLRITDLLFSKYNPTGVRGEKIIVDGADWDRDYFCNDIVPAASAIFLHSVRNEIQKAGIKIHFKKAPIAYLLILCDTLQEWDRPSKVEEAVSPSCANIKFTTDGIKCVFDLQQVKVDSIKKVLKNRLRGLNVNVSRKI